MNEHMILTFATSQGRDLNIRIPEPDVSLTSGQVQAAADMMIGGNIFNAQRYGDMQALRKAIMRTVTRSTLI